MTEMARHWNIHEQFILDGRLPQKSMNFLTWSDKCHGASRNPMHFYETIGNIGHASTGIRNAADIK